MASLISSPHCDAPKRGISNSTTTFQSLPEEVVEEILLKQDIRTEAMSRRVCRMFNRLTLSHYFLSVRQSDDKKLLRQSPEYCPLVVPSIVSDNLRGWDTAAQKWCNLPTLGFLPAAQKESMMISYMYSCDNGLLFLIYEPVTVKFEVTLRDRVMEAYVCNPFTRSYVAIGLSRTRPFWYRLMLRAGLGEPHAAAGHGSGFTLFDPSHVPVLKLQSNNMAAGWVELERPPAELEFWDARAYWAAPVMVDGVIYFLRRRGDRGLSLTGYDVDRGVWSDVAVPIFGGRHRSVHFHVNRVSRLPSSPSPTLKLMRMGGRLWVVQHPVRLHGQAGGPSVERTAFPSWGVMVSMLDPGAKVLIDVQSSLFPSSVVFEKFKDLRLGWPAICFIGDDGGTPEWRVHYSTIKPVPPDVGWRRTTDKVSAYNVMRNEWVEYPDPGVPADPVDRYKHFIHGGSFHLSHASLDLL